MAYPRLAVLKKSTRRGGDVHPLRLELARIFADILALRLEVRNSLDPYLADIRSIQKYLSNDLTPKGIEGVKPIAQAAIRDGEALKQAIRPLTEAISRARAELARGNQ